MYSKKNKLEEISNLVFLVLLLVVLTLFIYKTASFYEDIKLDSKAKQNLNVASSYLFVAVKSADALNAFDVLEYDGKKILVVNKPRQEGKTYIYHDDGYLRECFTLGEFDKNNGESIIELSDFDFNIRDGFIHYTFTYNDNLTHGNINLRAES